MDDKRQNQQISPHKFIATDDPDALSEIACFRPGGLAYPMPVA